MPNVKDLKEKNAKKSATQTELPLGGDEAAGKSRPKRRPGREEPEASDAQVRVVDVEHGVQETAGEELHAAHAKAETYAHDAATQNQTEPRSSADSSETPAFEAESEKPRVEIRFFGSELIRAKFPKPFEMAEAVATDWRNGGDFSGLPIKHPLAHLAAQKGLQQAKEVEKKVLESPVTEKVAMRVLTAGMKAQSVIEQVRSRLNQKKD